MPKAPTKTGSSNSTSVVSNALKRNQACHQCRKRKLKCDANRPCSTCVRSHAHAVSHAAPGVQLPSHPECTFDDGKSPLSPDMFLDTQSSPLTSISVREGSPLGPEASKNRYERLENRINELEMLLHQKNGNSTPDTPSMSTSSPDVAMKGFETAGSSPLTDPNFQYSPGSGSLPSDIDFIISAKESNAFNTEFDSFEPSGDVLTFSSEQSLLWLHWPPHLPDPQLVRHLVDLFFAHHPHASRLFHAPTFAASLSLPPSHPKFPIPAILHAICAVSTIYTGAIIPLPSKDADPQCVFVDIDHDQPVSFAEQHARFAKAYADQYSCAGRNLLQCIQAYVLLSWYYWCNAKWVELFTGCSHTLRGLVPLGLNVCPPFQSITKAVRSFVVPPASTVIEDETRRNTFWLAYTVDRLQGAGTGWAFSMDDQDISQLLPVRKDNFDMGILVPFDDRQWSHAHNIMLSHPPGQTDAFGLYVKGSMLISHVKTYNHRYQTKRHRGDPEVIPAYFFTREDRSHMLDPRTAPAFVELDDLIQAFQTSFPPEFKQPMTEKGLDIVLYSTCLIPHVCTILLHEPHADLRVGCVSAAKILKAARAILQLIHAVSSTNFDLGLLDYFCCFCWFLSGRVFARFLKASQDANDTEKALSVHAELEFVRTAMSQMSGRLPLAFRYSEMLNDLILKICGPVAGVNSTVLDSLPPPTIPTGLTLSDVALADVPQPFP